MHSPSFFSAKKQKEKKIAAVYIVFEMQYVISQLKPLMADKFQRLEVITQKKWL